MDPVREVDKPRILLMSYQRYFTTLFTKYMSEYIRKCSFTYCDYTPIFWLSVTVVITWQIRKRITTPQHCTQVRLIWWISCYFKQLSCALPGFCVQTPYYLSWRRFIITNNYNSCIINIYVMWVRIYRFYHILSVLSFFWCTIICLLVDIVREVQRKFML